MTRFGPRPYHEGGRKRPETGPRKRERHKDTLLLHGEGCAKAHMRRTIGVLFVILSTLCFAFPGSAQEAGGAGAAGQATSGFHIHQNYPNPFNPTTNIRFELKEQTRATLSVYNARGELVRTLVNGVLNSGTHNATFNGAGLPSGIYFYRLQASDTIEMRKMLLVK